MSNWFFTSVESEVRYRVFAIIEDLLLVECALLLKELLLLLLPLTEVDYILVFFSLNDYKGVDCTFNDELGLQKDEVVLAVVLVMVEGE